MRIRPRDWSLSTRLIAFSLALGVGSVGTLGFVSVTRSSSTLLEQQETTLESVANGRAHEIEAYFAFIQQQMVNFSQNLMVTEATASFSEAFASVIEEAGIEDAELETMTTSVKGYYDGEFRPRFEDAGGSYRGASSYVPSSAEGRALQAMYISNNPNPVGSKLVLDRATRACSYNDLHAKYHPRVRAFLESFGYYDIFLFDTEGNLVYSVFKETDYGTNFLNGPYKNTNFAEVYRAALASNTPGATFIEDYRTYEPSYGAPASFIGSPVFHEGEKVGVAIFQMPVDNINEIMTNATGLGETGQAYLVGFDGRMRSNSRFSDETTILAQKVETDAVTRLASGSSGAVLQATYTGANVLAYHEPIEIDGLEWGIIAEVEEGEILAPARALRTQTAAIGAVLGLAGAIGAFFFVRSLSSQIGKVVEATGEIAKGNLTVRLDDSRGDELGDMARATNALTESLAAMISDVKASAGQVAAASTEIAASAEEMAAGLQTQERQTMEISASIDELHSTVGDVAQQSTAASGAVDESGREAETGGDIVRSTIGQIEGIAAQVNESALAVSALGRKGDEIGEIIQVINDIAEQTNLLALNAAIEAARAGEHGRGFAVVADEVRKLAERTTQATDEVAKSIREIQSETGRAVTQIEAGTERVGKGVELANSAGEALERIVASSQRVRAMVQSIATAADQQSQSSQQIAMSMESISCVTRESNEGASQAAAAAMELSEQAENLNTIVSRFRI